MEERIRTQKPPLFNGAIVRFGAERFMIEKWNSGVTHYCYVFYDLAKENPFKPFAKKPSEVRQMLADKKLIIEKIAA